MKSVVDHLGSTAFPRLRIGVGPLPPGLGDRADYVLDACEPEERRTIDDLMDPMTEAVACWLTEGIETAMNRFNR